MTPIPPRKKKYNEPPESFFKAYSEIFDKHDRIKSMIKLMREGYGVLAKDPSIYWDSFNTLEKLSDDLDEAIRALLFRSGYDVVAGD